MFTDTQYSPGYSPAFIARVHAKRRMEREEAAKSEARQRVARERAAARKQARIEAQREEDRRAVEALVAQYREVTVRLGKISIAQIIAETALKHGVRIADITGVSRSRKVAAARHEAIWRARIERPDMSFPAIGKAFGNRDHTTCIYAFQKMEALKAA